MLTNNPTDRDWQISLAHWRFQIVSALWWEIDSTALRLGCGVIEVSVEQFDGGFLLGQGRPQLRDFLVFGGQPAP
ncbi:hypothetical protein MPUL_26590 [Mycolicibacterium pulveris]|uniref:Uncharacterized protein n=1 Tax=Mycolicibacterium pulveris TaxID=36813 RepID=A0A7I7UKZ7_MYCPV|nr:hypothetical protein MPUL_26590 [Mycolicibacterium pulveris]